MHCCVEIKTEYCVYFTHKSTYTERYRSGHNGADSKSVCEQSHAGSNPALSATEKACNQSDCRLFSYAFF